MKNISVLIAAILVLFSHACPLFGQPVMKGEVYLGANAGIGGQFYLKEFGDGLPFVSASVQKCFKDNWTANFQGGYGTARSAKYKIIDDSYFIEYQYALATAQVRYHFNLSANNDLDGYGGLGIYYYYGKGSLNASSSLAEFKTTYPDESDYGVSLLAGVRYWVSKRLAIYGEFAHGTLYSSFGLIYHLK